MKVLDYHTLMNCKTYANKVITFYQKCNNGNLPSSRAEIELAVREYNREWRSFKSLFGCSIISCIDAIVEYAGVQVVAMNNQH